VKTLDKLWRECVCVCVCVCVWGDSLIFSSSCKRIYHLFRSFTHFLSAISPWMCSVVEGCSFISSGWRFELFMVHSSLLYSKGMYSSDPHLITTPWCSQWWKKSEWSVWQCYDDVQSIRLAVVMDQLYISLCDNIYY